MGQKKIQNILIIKAGHVSGNYWKDLWRYRELFYFLAWRDILVRYKQTVIGIAWSVLRPVLTLVVFTIIFEKLAKLPADAGAPYAIMVFAGMLPWQLFASALSETSNSLINNSAMISKVYFPRLIIPGGSAIVGLIDFFLSFGIFALLMIWYQFIPDSRIVFLPLFVVLALITTFGAGIWMAALNVKYRDFRYIVPFIVQIGMYLSPIGFSSSLVPDGWRLIYSLNPMVGIIDGFRWAILGGNSQIYMPGLFLSTGVSFLLMWFGLRYFRNVERTFADLI